MSKIAEHTTWFPSSLNGNEVTICALKMQLLAREAGYTRETYAAAVASMSESLIGFEPEDDIDTEVLRFVGERFQAVASAIAKGGN
jgi:hypothetical protein